MSQDTSSPLHQTGPLTNADLAPVTQERRTWSTWDIAALWVGMAVCIPTYTMASGLIDSGMNWWQALLAVFLGNVIVLIPMLLNAHPGTAYGIPFPVLLRSSFGTLGANVAALMRGLVACGWFGIQTWLGGAAIYSTLALVFGYDVSARSLLPVLGISAGELGCFLLFWLVNVFFIVRGMESIKWLEKLSAPFLLLLGVLMMVWAWKAAGGFGRIFAEPSRFKDTGEAWSAFGAGLTAMVGFWATLSLNIPDFSRFARNQRSQIIGQTVALPTTMTLYAFIGIVVTSATVVIFGEAIWDPSAVVAKFGSKTLSIVALIAISIATLSTNIAANVVSPANDFSNLAPRWISFRMGGLLAATLGIFMMPWKLLALPDGYIYTWLIGYSALLGPIAGIMIADYHLIRKRRLDLNGLYDPRGPYRYTGGFSIVALGVFMLAVLPNLPGFLVAIGAWSKEDISPVWLAIYRQAWFTGFFIAFGLYLLLRKRFPRA